MAILKIVLWPNPDLKQVSEEVSLERAKSDEFKELVKDMTETLQYLGGVGISAIQVGVPERVFVARTKQGFQTFVNPVLEEVDGPTGVVEMQEGCLSVPGWIEKVKRYPNVVVSALDAESGERKRYDLEGIEAQCAQHELEHLDGKMFADDFGPVKRDIVKRKIKKHLKLRRQWLAYIESLQ